MIKLKRLSRSEVKEIIAHGRRVSSPFLSAAYLSPQGKNFCVAIVVSKKVARLAVTRNAIRRRIRHAIWEVLDDETTPHSVVIFVQKDVSTLSPTDLCGEVSNLLKKIKNIES